ncbi:hypothetical protein G7054_g7395 [Neopestalotiopsis clavispora]|nr:hypothetical protein G7054_g7395 [Neopestalotiopsis clavispora]
MADPLSVAGSAVGVISLGIQVAQSLFDYYSAFKSQYTDVADIAKKLDSLLEVLGSLQNHVKTRRFRADEQDLLRKIEGLINECEECIEELQEVANKFAQCPTSTVQSAIRATARRVSYPFRKSTFEKLDEDISDIIKCLQLALQLLQQEVVARVQNDLEDVKSLLNLVWSSQISSKIRDWLKAPDATINFNAASKKRHPQTGLWLVRDNTIFTNWLINPGSFLWLRGFAGCGKSDPKTGIAFFFFTFNDENKQDISALLRSLVLQLSTQSEKSTDLARLHDRFRDTAPPDDVLRDCLRRLIGTFQDVYIFIDALDESPRDKHREAALELLTEIRAWQEPRLHLLVTSRDEIDIRNELNVDSSLIVEMRNDEVDKDIALFITQSLRDNRKLAQWSQHHSIIRDALAQRAKGVFRWVECQFRALALCPPNQHLLEKLLSSLPESLDDTYVRMLRNIAPNLIEYAQSMLNILCCAVRPLSDKELLDALAVKVGKNYLYDPTRRFNNLDALEAICPGFIEVVTDFDTRNVTVRIAHFSVQEFLEAERILGYQEIASFHIKRPQGHTHMAAICLALLLAARASPALEYCARYWPEHLVQCNARAQIENEAVPLFQSTTGYFRRWVEAWDVDADLYGMPENHIPSPLYYASMLGLASVVSTLLGSLGGGVKPTLTMHVVLPMITIDSEPSSVLDTSENHIDVNVVGGRYGTALQAASRWGHQEVVQLLLVNGADVNAFHSIHGTALHLASLYCHQEVMQLLLDKSADVINAVAGIGGTALQAASRRGRREVVQLLLDHGADVNAVDEYQGTALQVASREGRREVVQLLLDHGADINVVDGDVGTALQAASYKGHCEIVQLLLDHGADVDAVREYHGTALQQALRKGHREVVQLLLDNGADVNVVGGRYGTALQAASAKGHQEVVRLLATFK